MPKILPLPLAAVFAASLPLAAALAEDAKTYSLSLKGTVFTPAEIKVPAGQAFMLEFTNENDKPAEIESADLRIEKVAPPKSKVVVRVKALEAGTYGFVDEFQEDEAKGAVIAE